MPGDTTIWAFLRVCALLPPSLISQIPAAPSFPLGLDRELRRMHAATGLAAIRTVEVPHRQHSVSIPRVSLVRAVVGLEKEASQ